MEHQENITGPILSDTRLIRIPITSDPNAWGKMLYCALRFLRARAKCYVHIPRIYDHRPGQYLGDYYQLVSTEHEGALYLLWRDLLQSGNWKNARELERVWEEDVQEAQHPADDNASTTPRNSSSGGLHLLDLPIEIVEQIFEYAVGGSYELQANLIRLRYRDRPDNNSTQLIFYQPRLWADLNVFQICRAFRTLAIKYYGVPQQSSLPFSPKMDTMVVHGEKQDQFGRINAECGVAFSPNLRLQDWENEDHWLLRDGVYSFNHSPVHVRPWSTPMAVSAEFLQRPTKIIMQVDVGTIYKWDWEDVWLFLGQTFVNTQCLKFNICHMDICGATEKVVRLPELRGNFRAHDLWVLMGLAEARQKSHRRIFSRLEALEIEKVGTCCSSSWGQRSQPDVFSLLGNEFIKF
ncbi:hypothetical protein F4776DRAFT_126561 [Hypoxylon sp. NC0597]|nr:hypothetical protein F4776DRAFT_126561 [Hypoxylon sp. NC0597]